MPAGIRPQKNLVGGGWASFTHYGWASGYFNSGQLQGWSSLAAVSGPGDFVLQSGAGRVDCLEVIQTQVSGWMKPVVFYDAAAVLSGGPVSQSGHKIVGQIPGFINIQSGLPGSGNTAFAFPAPGIGQPASLSFAFQSGLSVNVQSGQPAFSMNFSAEPATNL